MSRRRANRSWSESTLKVLREHRVQHFVEMVQRDSILLIAAEPMVAGFEKKSWSLIGFAETNQHGQAIHAAQKRFVFDRKRSGGRHRARRILVIQVLIAFEDVLGDFSPKSPDENAARVPKRNRETAADEESFPANDTNVRGDFAVRFLTARAQGEKSAGFREPDIEWEPIVGQTAALADVSHGFCFRHLLTISELRVRRIGEKSGKRTQPFWFIDASNPSKH
jgi:hypothetical protein